MTLDKLHLLNFKNYTSLQAEFSPKANCLVGNNGVGKTNILDAIHYLSLCKSYLNLSDIQNIKHDEDFFLITGHYRIDESEEEISCAYKRNQRKSFRRNKKEYERLSDHIGLIPLVMISPQDIAIIFDGSEERRKIIDSVISQSDKIYLDDLIRYNKALAQRNKLLKDMAQGMLGGSDILDVYSEQLVIYGTKIFEKRKVFISSLIPVFQKYYQAIAGIDEPVTLEYVSQLHEDNLASLLVLNMSRDRAFEYTTCGIHKDDLSMMLYGHPIKRIGSQGQQKTFVVALKFAEFEFIANATQRTPLLLLDDIFDKFDAKRVQEIIKITHSPMFGQMFITDTEPWRIKKALAGFESVSVIYEIENMQLTKIE